MKHILKKATTILLACVLLLGVLTPVSVIPTSAATGITMETYNSRKNAFINDSRWKDYASYGAISPKLSYYNSNGCCAYAADFCAYVYGSYSYAWNTNCFTPFYSPADIRTGDIIQITNHWFVVLERSGNSLRVADGNVSGKWARISNNYWIDSGKLYDNWNSRYANLIVGYHYNFTYPIPGKSTMKVSSNPTENKDIVFSWTATNNTNSYDLRLYKEGKSDAFKVIYGIKNTSYSYKLSAGKYKARLASVYNAYCCTYSDYISFTVNKSVHKHSYKTQTTKATATKNGYTVEKCSCGATKNKKTIYYPKKVTLSKTTYKYDGKTKTPTVKVVGSNNKTISSKNYTITYSAGRKKAGTYKVVVKFKGNYSGSVTKTFKVDASKHKHSYKKAYAKATTSKNGYIQNQCTCGTVKNKQVIYYPKKVTLSSTSYTYNGKTKTPTVKVVNSNNKTISSKNYTVTYSSGRKKAGTYKVVVKFKGNYSGSVTKTFTITNKWVYVDKLPSKVTSKKYEIQYKNIYQKNTTVYQNSGKVYESIKALPTSNTRQLVDYYYYHFCSGSTGQYVNFAQTNKYVHYDHVASSSVAVTKVGQDSDDPSINYYFLKWKSNNKEVWCSSSSTCDGKYGSHGARARAWYRMNRYQDKKKVNKTITTESQWTTKKDSSAKKVKYRYRIK